MQTFLIPACCSLPANNLLLYFKFFLVIIETFTGTLFVVHYRYTLCCALRTMFVTFIRCFIASPFFIVVYSLCCFRVALHFVRFQLLVFAGSFMLLDIIVCISLSFKESRKVVDAIRD